MKKIKAFILAILFFLIYTYLFLFWWGWIVSIIFAIFFIIFLFTPWKERPKLNFIKKFWKNIMENKYKFFIPPKDATVAVALSGGVDSAVSAYLLKKQGYKVKAFFMRNWDSTINQEYSNILSEDEICQQEEDYNVAKEVADFLGIELVRVNFVEEYWNLVFKRFLEEIELGTTPNPDVFCNRFIKFDKFLEYINKNHPEIDYVATGHYAKIKTYKNQKFLFSAKDPIKDQTYFLSEIDKASLNKIFFPLGDMDKADVRKIAKEANLPNANRKDSMGICFIGKRNFPEFISNYLEKKPGKIVDQASGKIVGDHQGVLFYTIGQRKGLNLGGFEKPYFVSGKDLKENILYVANEDQKDLLYTDEIVTENFHLLTDSKFLSENKAISFKTRHSEVIYHGIIKTIAKNNDKLKLEIKADQPIKFITPGQELVLYDNQICLGGGQIK